MGHKQSKAEETSKKGFMDSERIVLLELKNLLKERQEVRLILVGSD